MKNVLITGVNGFVGQHLVRELYEENYTVNGVGGTLGLSEQPEHLETYVMLDLTDPSAAQSINFTGIDGIIHLAGLAAVGPSFDNPLHYISVNMGIEINLLEAAILQGAKPRLLVVSSGSLYAAGTSLPITEDSPVLPSSPYAVSKLGQEQMAQYYNARGLECVIARPFNHCGPGQRPGFIVPDIAQQLVAVENNRSDKVLVGNLDAARDYTDVRDIVRAYRLLLEKGRAGEIYNICSGEALTGHQILSGLKAATVIDAHIEQDSSKMRPADTPVIYGDHSKITADTGWRPMIPIERTFVDVIEYWRQNV